MAVRSGALNLYRKNGTKQQGADIKKAFGKADILSLSEVHGNEIAAWARENGYGYFKGPDDTAIIWKPQKVQLVPGTQGSEQLNQTRGKTGGMRRRHAAYAQFVDVDSGKQFWQVSAHTTPPNQGSKAHREKIRNEQYRSLNRLAKTLGGPVLIAGDLNYRDPNIGKMESGFDGGIMHVVGSGASAVDLDRIGHKNLNSDHAAVVGTYRFDGGSNDRVDLEGDEVMPQGEGAAGGGRRDKNRRGKHANKIADFAADYGWSEAFIRANPELEKVFEQAIENTWSPARFVAEIQDTNWFKRHADTWRQAEYLQKTDPKTYQQRVNQIRASLRDRAGALGIVVSPDLLNKWAEQAMRFGWDDAKIANHLARQVDITGKNAMTLGGDLAATQERLNAWAMDNGVKVSPKTMQNWLRAIVRGDSTFEEYKQHITKQAIAAHPNWGKELRAGMSLADVAEPYKNIMAETLELNPEEVRTNWTMIRRALSVKKDDGSFDSMNLYDFEDMLRKDPRWLKTDGAKQQVMETGSAVLRMFGLST